MVIDHILTCKLVVKHCFLCVEIKNTASGRVLQICLDRLRVVEIYTIDIYAQQ
jgi:hypothetical protein